MSALITTLFTNSGTPATGLTPTIRIWEVSGLAQILIIGGPNGSGLNVDGSMIEVDDGTSQDGFYKYEFTTVLGFDPSKEYVVRVDGGVALPAVDRYQAGELEINVLDEPIADHVLPGSAGDSLNQIDIATQQLLLDVNDVNILVTLLLKYDTNRTKIDTVAKTLTVYDDDCTTILRVFNLLDSNGVPSVSEVCERKPVLANDGLPVCP